MVESGTALAVGGQVGRGGWLGVWTGPGQWPSGHGKGEGEVSQGIGTRFRTSWAVVAACFGAGPAGGQV